jgi:hypothetical protein
MVDQPEDRPAGRQHRPPQVLVGQAGHRFEHVPALAVQHIEKFHVAPSGSDGRRAPVQSD